MKRIAMLFICFMLFLCACSGEKQPEAPTVSVPTQTQPPQTEPDLPPEPTDASTSPTVEESLRDKAMTCLNQPVEELLALVGAPDSSEYAPSCLGDGEDGCLYYEDFTVYTYREGDQEIVQYVE